MAIHHVRELEGDATGSATLIVGGDRYEGIYYKSPETGEVEVRFVEPPIGAPGVLVLHDGHDSTYRGELRKDGTFAC